jgi:ATP phosphoribosyltransferase regulatory subunit
MAAAGEVVAVAIEALQAAGATGISVDFTMPGLVDALAAGPLPLTPAQLDAVRRELDAKDAGALVAEGGAAYLPLIHATGPLDAAIARLEAWRWARCWTNASRPCARLPRVCLPVCA